MILRVKAKKMMKKENGNHIAKIENLFIFIKPVK